ncbi:MAG: exonuclease, partial [Rhizobiales bacterium]|nr:exonuclease [Hyphomicrobiales bacterium]
MDEPADIHVATDIECNGPSPGHHSMLSFASVAFTPDKTILATFARNLTLLQGAGEHPDT